MGKKLVCEDCLIEVREEEGIKYCPNCGEEMKPKTLRYSWHKFLFTIDRIIGSYMIFIIILIAAAVAYKFLR